MIRLSLGDNYIPAYWHEQHMVGGYQKGMSNCQEWIGLKTCRVELCKKDLLHESAQEVLFGFGSSFVTMFCF